MMVGDREHLSTLKCSICIQFLERLVLLCNYNAAFINGSVSICMLAFKEHTETEMHKQIIALYTKQHSTNVCNCAPIARSLLQPLMDEATRIKLKQKHEISYLIAKENIVSKKSKPL